MSFVSLIGKDGETFVDLCNRSGVVCPKDGLFYQVTKKEDVSATKEMILHNVSSGEYIVGAAAVRAKMKRDNGAIKVGPADVPAGFALFVQSTSFNRKLYGPVLIKTSVGPLAPSVAAAPIKVSASPSKASAPAAPVFGSGGAFGALKAFAGAAASNSLVYSAPGFLHKEYPNFESVYAAGGNARKSNVFKKSSIPAVTSGFQRIIHQVVFLLDVTGSMQGYIDGTKQEIVKFIDSLKRKCVEDMESQPDYKEGTIELQYEVALIAYRDFCDQKHFESIDFTTNIPEVEAFLGSLLADGGGDEPEDVQGAFIHALHGIDNASPKLSWETETNREDIASRTMLWLADAPGHGSDFIQGGLESGNASGNKKLFTQEWEKLFDEMKRLSITLFLVKVNDKTQKSNSALKNFAAGKIETNEIDISQSLKGAKAFNPSGGFSYPAASSAKSAFDATAGYDTIMKSVAASHSEKNVAMMWKKMGNSLFKVVTAIKGETVKALCARSGETFTAGCGYYMLVKKEDVGAEKGLLLFDGKTVIFDETDVRSRLGKGAGAIKVAPSDVPSGWSLYVQSTSHTRKLDGGPMLIKSSKGVSAGSIVHVNSSKVGETVEQLCQREKLAYSAGCGYILLTAKESITADKLLILYDGKTHITDEADIRARIGKGSGVVTVNPSDIPAGWSLYVQSTDPDRKLDGGSVQIKLLVSFDPDMNNEDEKEDEEDDSKKPVKKRNPPVSKSSRPAKKSAVAEVKDEEEDSEPEPGAAPKRKASKRK